MISEFTGHIRSDSRGATLVEFALILTPLLVILFGALDVGYRMYMSSVLQGVVHQAARQGTLEDQDGEEIDQFVRNQIAELSPNGEVNITRRNYTEFTGVGQPEKITQDTAPLGECNPGDWYLDENFNNQYDRDRGSAGQGGADDIIQFSVEVEYPRLIPFGNLFGTDDTTTIAANTVMQNQPFAAQVNAEPQQRQVTSC